VRARPAFCQPFCQHEARTSCVFHSSQAFRASPKRDQIGPKREKTFNQNALQPQIDCWPLAKGLWCDSRVRGCPNLQLKLGHPHRIDDSITQASAVFAVKHYFRLTTIIFPFKKRECIAAVGLGGMWESRSDFQVRWKGGCAFHQSVISTGFSIRLTFPASLSWPARLDSWGC
jgi:hypothetical protein